MSNVHPDSVADNWRRHLWLLPMAGIIAVAFNLRPAVASIGPLLGPIRDELHMGGALAGLLTALPVLCFAAFGSVAAALSARIGARRVVMVGMLIAALGLGIRTAAPNDIVFFATSAVALSGIAVSNVVIPVLVRQYFPHHIGMATGVYSMVLSLGATTTAAISVPLTAIIGHSWRGGLGIWSVVALAAVLPWLVIRAPAREHTPGRVAPGKMKIYRSRTAWALSIFFGAQGLSAYFVIGWMPQILTDAGIAPSQAGLLLALTTGLAIPVALLLPSFAGRMRDHRLLAGGMTVLIGLGYLGLALAPATLPWVWAILMGVGGGCFPLALTMIGMRTSSTRYTAALSGFAQSVGYLIAAVGPFLVGTLHDATDGWAIPIGVVGLFLLPQFIAGMIAGRDRKIEDELAPPAKAATVVVGP